MYNNTPNAEKGHLFISLFPSISSISRTLSLSHWTLNTDWAQMLRFSFNISFVRWLLHLDRTYYMGFGLKYFFIVLRKNF